MGESLRWNHAVGFTFIALGGVRIQAVVTLWSFVWLRVLVDAAPVRHLSDGGGRCPRTEDALPAGRVGAARIAGTEALVPHRHARAPGNIHQDVGELRRGVVLVPVVGPGLNEPPWRRDVHLSTST
jgi:hypothetical protein